MATPTVVLLPVWGAGHLMSMLDAGKRLLARSGGSLSLTVLVMQAPTESYRSVVAGHICREEASGLDISFLHLPAVEPPTDHVGAEDFVSRFVELHAAHVKAAISGLTCPVAALIIDFFGTTLLDVARELAVPSYVYFTASAAMYALFLRLPALHEEVTVEFEQMEGMVDVPGLPLVPPSTLPTPMMDKTKPSYTWFVYHGRRFMEAQGVIVNTAGELEQSVIAAIADGRCTGGIPAPKVYPIGPVVSFGLLQPASGAAARVRAVARHAASGVRRAPLLRRRRVLHRDAGARDRPGAGAQRAPLPVGAAWPAGSRRAAALGRGPRGAAPGGVPGEDEGEGHGLADEGAAGGYTRARCRGGLRDARRLELGPGEPLVRRAHGAVAALRRAAPQRLHSGRLHGRGRGHGGGQEEQQFRSRVGAGTSREDAHGRRLRRREEGEGEVHGDEGCLQEGRPGGGILLLCTLQALGGDTERRRRKMN